MTTDDYLRLRDDLERDEGLRLLPYVDTVGKISIGFGRNLSDNGITQAEAVAFLVQDIRRSVSDVFTAFPWVATLDAPRQAVLVQMCYNMGLTRLKGFKKFLAALYAGNYGQAAVEMLDSRWADQVGARATRLASVMHSGEWK